METQSATHTLRHNPTEPGRPILYNRRARSTANPSESHFPGPSKAAIRPGSRSISRFLEAISMARGTAKTHTANGDNQKGESPMNAIKPAIPAIPAIVPEIGMGVTYLSGSDRYPFTVTKVNTPRKLTIQADKEASFLRPHFREIRLHKSGHWFDTNGMQYRIGDRESYLDPSF